MEIVSQERSRLRGIVRMLAVLAILATGYAGMQLGSFAHSTTSAAAHSQLAESCASGFAHC